MMGPFSIGPVHPFNKTSLWRGFVLTGDVQDLKRVGRMGRLKFDLLIDMGETGYSGLVSCIGLIPLFNHDRLFKYLAS